MDLQKEFNKKTNVNFRTRRYRNVKPDIIICGFNKDNYQALKPEHVLRLCHNDKNELEKLAQDLGCINTQVARFHVELIENHVDYIEDDYGDISARDIDIQYYFLVATEK